VTSASVAKRLKPAWPQGVARCAVAIVLASGASTGALAQTQNPDDRAPADARVLFGSLAVVPTIRLTNVGWDDNVLYATEDQPRTEDFTATVSPDVQAWYRVPYVRARGSSVVDFVYFREVSQFRSIDTDNSGRVDLLLGRVTPYVSGGYANTRHRQNLEIDLPVRRVDAGWNAGVDLRLTGKTSVGVVARNFSVDYQGDTEFLNTDLSATLDAKTAAEGARVWYALTPFTTLSLGITQSRSRFELAPERNSDNVRLTSAVEFRPFVPVSGRAEYGVLRRTFVDGDAPSFKGSVARVDLGYTLFGRTRFAIGYQRDLQASFRIDQRDYLQTGTQLSVTHRLTNAWDVRGMLGRFNLAYGVGQTTGAPIGVTEERVRMYGLDVGRYVGGMRVGLQVARQGRTSDSPGGRDYVRTRIVSSVTYGI
jgi:hypothetical protein